MSEHTFDGIHSMPHDQYRKANGISKSDLDLIAISPAHFKARDLMEDETPAKRFGSLLHQCLLEPESADFYVKPEAMTFTTKEGKVWREEHQDKPIITSEEWKLITCMKTAVFADETAKRLLVNGRSEQCLFAKDDDGVVRKCRIDYLPDKGNVIVDVKTLEDGSPRKFERALYDYRWAVQAGYYLSICDLVGLEKDAFVFIVCEKSPPFAVQCYRADEDTLAWGRFMFQRDLQVYRNCVASGKWPAYGGGILEAGLPIWARKEMEAVI